MADPDHFFLEDDREGLDAFGGIVDRFIAKIGGEERASLASNRTGLTVAALPFTQRTTFLTPDHIWAETVDISVTYRADTKLYIDTAVKQNETEDDMTADRNIASGAYFQIGATLYKATAAIATSETIIPGTNCVKTTIAEVLNLLSA